MQLCGLLVMLAVGLVAGQGQVCPNGRRCSDGSCCPSNNNDQPYGCCPFLNAVCCADRMHCCPTGYQCDLARGMCVQSTSAGPFGQPVVRLGGGGGDGGQTGPTVGAGAMLQHKCQDGSSCADTATCCQIPNGSYACCPEKNAVCCEDHIHCCPEGSVCDVAARTCKDKTRHAVLNLL
ncbi:progranulin-like isoform X2 [Pollicipes pollicipes]|uniref:progranulin-like isoform X2 n=1 Tax=Pollicipes pollicipes TaxID=41117 RepID=UPI0018853BFC|nr:progranulin-like isoform X2 [Pollicipes pollicipes]